MKDWDRIIADLHNVEDIDRATAACEELATHADESSLPQLYELLLNGRDFFIREAVADPIARLEGMRCLRQLLHVQHLGEKEGHDNDGINALISDLVCSNPKDATPILKELVRSPSEFERESGAWLWGFASSCLPSDQLISMVNDSSPRVRASAIGSLSSYQNLERTFSAILKGLDDQDENVRQSTVLALGYYGDKRAVDPIRRQLINASNPMKLVIECALERLEKTT